MKQPKQIYLVNSTKKFGNIDRIFCKLNKTVEPKALIYSDKEVGSNKWKLTKSNQNIFWNQTNVVKRTILYNQLNFFSGSTISKISSEMKTYRYSNVFKSHNYPGESFWLESNPGYSELFRIIPTSNSSGYKIWFSSIRSRIDLNYFCLKICFLFT